MVNNNRCDYLDVYKGVAILCIVLLHYEDGVFPSWLNVFVGSFMIAAFYVSSGWIMGIKGPTTGIKAFVRKRLYQLGKPYLYFSIIYLVFDLVLYLFNYYDIYFIGREAYKAVTLRGIGTLWFLPALFGGEVLTLCVIKKRAYYQILFLLIALLYLFFYEYWNDNYRNISAIYQIIDAPLRVCSNALSAFVIITYSYYVATVYKRYVDIKVTTKLVLMLLFLTIYVVGYLFNLGVIERSKLVVFALLLGVLIFSYFLSKFAALKSFFSYWGRNSLIVMLTHYSIIQVLCEIVNKYVFKNESFSGYVNFAYFIITLILLYPIIWIMNRKFKTILGKR